MGAQRLAKDNNAPLFLRRRFAILVQTMFRNHRKDSDALVVRRSSALQLS